LNYVADFWYISPTEDGLLSSCNSFSDVPQRRDITRAMMILPQSVIDTATNPKDFPLDL